MMRTVLPFFLFLVALPLQHAGQVNFSEEKEAIQNPENSISSRVASFDRITQELKLVNAEAVLPMADLLLELPLSKKQRVLVLARKSRALTKFKDAQQAYDLLTEAILEFSESDADILFHLYFERGITDRYVAFEDKKKLARILDDFNMALNLAETVGDTEMLCAVHDQLGFIHGNYLKEKGTARGHYEFIIFNANDEVDLAQARANLAKLSKPEQRIERDTAIHYLMSSRDIFSQNGLFRKVGKTTITIAKYLREADRLDEAKQEYEAALNMGLPVGDKITCLEYLGQIANDQGRYEDAESWFQQGLVLDKSINGSRSLYIATKLGEAWVKMDRAQGAFELCDSLVQQVEADSSYTDFKRATRLTDCWDCIGQAHLALSNYRDAFTAFENRDSAESAYGSILEARQAKIKLDLYEYDTLRKQTMQEDQYRLQSERQTYLYAIVALLIAFAMFITYRYRFTQRQSNLISTQRQQLSDRQRELIRANADLEIALNHKAVFLSNMSHEIRTPLNAIVGMSNLASKEDMADAAKKYLRNIVIASSNLIDIVNDILDFSKLEAGKLEIAEEPFSVKDALEVAENVMRIPAEQKDLSFSVEADPHLPSHLIGDSSRLNQVLINLIGNAVKFTLDGGVTMQASVRDLPELPVWCPAPAQDHDQWFVIRVKDTGIGIPADKLEKIFESFNQGDTLKTRKFGGTGLGLSISKQIVELQGGVIWVESQDGIGSDFCFALPAIVAEVQEMESDDDALEEHIGPIRILIAEDNPFNVIVTEDTLKSELEGVTIGKAENGRLAYEMVRDGDWDLVLMDIHMPEMSGLEATAAIRKLPNEKAQTLIVAMTASVLREETDNYMRHGMDGFVPKPFQAAQLKHEIFRLQKSKNNQAKTGTPPLPHLRILIAEDNPFNVIVAEDTLRSELTDITIGKAENGKLALEAVKEGEWDIVLMDIAMPEMTGIEATLAIRALSDDIKASTTIIAMTASVLKEDTDHYLKQGMDGFVPKPFKAGQLIQEIKRAHLEKGEPE